MNAALAQDSDSVMYSSSGRLAGWHLNISPITPVSAKVCRSITPRFPFLLLIFHTSVETFSFNAQLTGLLKVPQKHISCVWSLHILSFVKRCWRSVRLSLKSGDASLQCTRKVFLREDDYEPLCRITPP